MSNQVFQQNLDDKKGPQPGGPYLIQMLFKEPVEMPDKEKMTAVMEKHIGSAECFCYDTHVNLDAPVPGLYRDSIILLEQLRTIDKSRLRGKVGSLGEDQMCKLDHALEVSVGLLPLYNTI